MITRDNLKEVDKLLDQNNEFGVILTNLFLSANNPFQSNFAFVQDMSYNDKIAAQIKNDYEQTGSLAYIFNRKHFIYKVVAGPSD